MTALRASGLLVLFCFACFDFHPPRGLECNEHDDELRDNCPAGKACVEQTCRVVCSPANLSADCGPAEACMENKICMPYSSPCTTTPDCLAGFFCQAESCRRKLPVGEACSASDACRSDSCVDNVCCDAPCPEVCFSCAAALTGVAPGSCAPTLVGMEQGDECGGVTVCSGLGACFSKGNGEGCGNAFECATGACIDNVCCETACAGACEACSATLTTSADGVCAPIPRGSDPDGACSGGMGCDGNRGCVSGALDGVVCGQDSQCANSHCVDGVCCSAVCGAVCEACTNAWTGAANGTCAPILAGLEENDECSGPTVCAGTRACFAKTNGTICDQPHECTSGYCVDGVCCTTCGGICQACLGALTGSADGLCAPLPAYSDPELECAGWGCSGQPACHPPKAWGTTVTIETEPGTARAPQIAMDAAGNAIAVWHQDDGSVSGPFSIWANRYTAGGSWGTAVRIETGDGTAGPPMLAVNGAGNAVVVWMQYDSIAFGSDYSIWANRYTAGGSWGTATPIESSRLNISNNALGHVGMDSAGNAIAVWKQGSDMWANRYVAGGSWGTPIRIEAATDLVNTPTVAMDPSGNATALWLQYDGTRFNIWANHYTAGSWGTASLIEAVNENAAGQPHIAMDQAGNAIAVWVGYDGTRNNLWANHYAAAGTWGAAVPLEASAISAGLSGVAIDSVGRAMVVWLEYDSGYKTWINRYVPGGPGWQGAERIGQAFLQLPAAQAMDGHGNAIVVWVIGSLVGRVMASRYAPGFGWGAPLEIEQGYANPPATPQIAVDSAGNAVAVWVSDDNTNRNVRSNILR